VPVFNDQRALERCVGALIGSAGPDVEVMVVDDASTDDSASVAARLPVRLLRLPTNAGPAAARNHGAEHARGDILLFVDSDVIVAPGTLERVMAVFEARPDMAAVFGSYDASPAAAGVVSRYRTAASLRAPARRRGRQPSGGVRRHPTGRVRGSRRFRRSAFGGRRSKTSSSAIDSGEPAIASCSTRPRKART
jgi:glycosyltransferase involved in cell wall biosynthesis